MTFFSITDHFQCNYPSLRNFTFQYKHDFYNISYCRCHEKHEHLEWKLSLIKLLGKKIGKPEKFDTYGYSNINKSNVLAQKIRENKISEILETPAFEICSIYCDNAGKDYCFGVQSDYHEHMSTIVFYDDNIRKALKEIDNKEIFDKDEKEYIKSSIIELKRYNKDEYGDLSEIQKIKLTKLLSKQFINQLQ
jgi:hypothetical protein